ncbi:M23 family peptidase [Oceanobacillus chungangensis]|uniref:M23 family peptidase n=1 Tax=Oceanobacillus chungangensis TaxID=1229152 RepID=A0A3D8PUL9_9BACI|nr:M23 family peptidase [Oceanobacillus chungangensis]
MNPEDFGSIFQNEDFEKLYHCTSKDFQQQISIEQFIALAAPFNTGVKHYQLEYKSRLQELNHYIWLDNRKEKAIAISFDKHQQIQRLYLKPFITYPESDKRYTKNTYYMPIKGEWFVFWGGANELINYHYIYESQRYAYDLVKENEGLSYRNTKILNENFYAFNEEIIAPADGKVIKIIDGFKDNIPGEMDAENPGGNYVIIEHSKKEYSLLAHLKKNSIQVQAGDLVKQGQCIGKCGNSGNSSEPHLHFQVMDSSDFESGKSLRIRFKDGVEPIQGDTISNVSVHRDAIDEKIDKVDNALTIGELLLLIPRAIAQFFK